MHVLWRLGYFGVWGRVLPALPRKRTALIVDDDSTLRYVMARIAQHAGYETFDAYNANLALEFAVNNAPTVIVSDLLLPDFDGFGLCRRLKADRQTKSIPVILVTSMYYKSAHNDHEIAAGRKQAKSCGALALFPRGEALEELEPILKKLKSPATKSAAKKVARKKTAKSA